MLFNYDYLQIMILILTYMTLYNVTSFALFATLLQFMNLKIKTLYSFATLGASNIYTKILMLIILSLAGVPPLLGFFSKIFVFVLIANSSLVILFPSLFILLFVGLYFYVQNLRFLNSTSKSNFHAQAEKITRVNPIYFTFVLPICFILIFGFCYLDDFILLCSWILL
mgnify:CR=1 FL=1